MIQINLWEFIGGILTGIGGSLATILAFRAKWNKERREEMTKFFEVQQKATEKAADERKEEWQQFFTSFVKSMEAVLSQEQRHEQRHQNHEQSLRELREWKSGFEDAINEKFEIMKERMTSISSDVGEIRKFIYEKARGNNG